MIVKEVSYADYQQAIRQIRTQVFVREQAVPEALEYDDRDTLCRHVLAFDGVNAVATGRIDLDNEGKIGRVAVLAEHRNHGVGVEVMHALHRIARRAGLSSVYLNAQLAAKAFYLSQGYLPEGEEFMEAGIPHQAMVKRIDAEASQ